MTGVQTCALPIYPCLHVRGEAKTPRFHPAYGPFPPRPAASPIQALRPVRKCRDLGQAVARDRCNGRARPGRPGRLGSGTAAVRAGRLQQARPSLERFAAVSSPSKPILISATISPALGIVNSLFSPSPFLCLNPLTSTAPAGEPGGPSPSGSSSAPPGRR